MRQLILSLVFLFITIDMFSQTIFILESLPENTPEQDFIYLAGSLNDWNPGDQNLRFHKNVDGLWELELAAQPEGNSIAFKFTRGSWETVEKDAAGQEMANRQFTFGNGETVFFSIAQWADNGGGGGGSTAAENVSILSDDFYMPQLDRYRRIWIYLPPDYEQSDKEYPVLYMHDGQNLFDRHTSFSGEWEVDETLNDLAQQGMNVPIVIGIDNGGGHRMDEYSAWLNSQYGGGEGQEYIRFIVETLKPYIDENYRTLTAKNNTGVMGSSLGGFISHYAIFQEAGTFGKAGLFSPSYWYSDSVWAFTEMEANAGGKKIYQIIGSEEGSSAVNDMQQMHQDLISYGFTSINLKSEIVSGQGHHEAFWRDEFQAAYLWLFADYVNGIEQPSASKELVMTPNPVNKYLSLGTKHVDSLKIYDVNGKLVMSLSQLDTPQINVSDLESGLYLIELNKKGSNTSGKFIKL